MCNTTLTRVDLSNNLMGNEGIKIISDSLMNNTSITHLDIGANNIGPDGAKSISALLLHNCTLKTLYLSPKPQLNNYNNVNINNNPNVYNTPPNSNPNMFTPNPHVVKSNSSNANDLRSGHINNQNYMMSGNTSPGLVKSNSANANDLHGSSVHINNQNFIMMQGNPPRVVKNNSRNTNDLHNSSHINNQNYMMSGSTTPDMMSGNTTPGLVKTNSTNSNDLHNSGHINNQNFMMSSSTAAPSLYGLLPQQDNRIEDGGANFIAESLKANTSLTFLSLAGNGIGDDGAKSLADSLAYNSTLTHLHLESNSISEIGSQYLSQALSNNSSLTELSLSYTKEGNEEKKIFRMTEENRIIKRMEQKFRNVLNLQPPNKGIPSDSLQQQQQHENNEVLELKKEFNQLSLQNEQTLNQLKEIKKLLQHSQQGGVTTSTTGADPATVEIKTNLVKRVSLNLAESKESNIFYEKIITTKDQEIKIKQDIINTMENEINKLKKELVALREEYQQNLFENYKISTDEIEFLGDGPNGSFGYVKFGKYCKVHSVAIKYPHHYLYDTEKENFKREIFLNIKLKHPNIVRTLGYGEENNKLFLCTEQEVSSMTGVADMMSKAGRIWTCEELLKIAHDISLGMEYLHQNDIIHRDLNLGNFLVSKDFTVKISDFGLSKSDSYSKKTKLQGPPFYMAPEVETETYTVKSDVWSFAVAICDIISNKLIKDRTYGSTTDQHLVLLECKRLYPDEADLITRLSDLGCKVVTYITRRDTCLSFFSNQYQKFYDILLDCFNLDEKLRPDFSTIKMRIKIHPQNKNYPNIDYFINLWKK
eukprot:TRINITY_DN1090_c0_g1_i1.p1 TRINITY_DN1090_c0_g1~~TRINITY_DN1090_c0_g1_i1.p1  ORF type:complete len:946 (+),score=170.98 TRINITY_DN1090_c0_g1_i1:387-2840(+)